MRKKALEALLKEAYDRHARPGFIEADPIHIPKAFADRRDAELIGFYTATIAWGQRKTIIANARALVRLMDEAPHDFVTNATEAELQRLARFVHRTFNGTDLLHFIRASRHVLGTYGDLEQAFTLGGDVVVCGAGVNSVRQRGACHLKHAHHAVHAVHPLLVETAPSERDADENAGYADAAQHEVCHAEVR
ncbi:MAG: DUF2400 family protein, partial [Flavobacteriales bacterium]